MYSLFYILFLFILVPLLTYLIIKSANKRGIDPDRTLVLIILCGISFFVGARGGYLILNYRYFALNLSNTLRFWDGGFSIHGGIILAGFVGALYLRFNLSDMYKFGDAVAPFLALSISIARIGCFMRGCCFGKWGHPVQLYEAGATFLLSSSLFYIERKISCFGKGWWTFIAGYATIRLFLDRFRADIQFSIFGVFSPIDILNLTLIFISSLGFLRLRCGQPPNPKEVS